MSLQRALMVLGVLLAALFIGQMSLNRADIPQGVEAWDEGDLETALQVWEPMALQPTASAALRYNVGAAWYAIGDLPRALAWWRAARLSAPRDNDLTHNIALARSHLTELPPPAGAPRRWMAFVTPGELALLAFAFALVFSFTVRTWMREEGSPASWVLSAIAAVVLTLIALDGTLTLTQAPLGVVIDDAGVRATPNPRAPPVFVLSPGTEVQIPRDVGDFTLVEIGDGRRGWIASELLLRVPTR